MENNVEKKLKNVGIEIEKENKKSCLNVIDFNLFR